MARSPSLLAIACAIASAAGQATFTASEPRVLSLFAIDLAEPTATPTIQASIVRADDLERETVYWVQCIIDSDFDLDDIGRPPSAPCNYLYGASLTLNPSGVTMRIARESQVLSVSNTDVSGDFTTEETYITVSGTVSCEIHGSSSASCTGDLTSRPTTITYLASSRVLGSHSTVSRETISSEFTDAASHYVPVTVTAGFEELPTTTTSLSSTASTGAAAAAALVTGVRHAAVVGAAALAGGVALL
ncbi:hypothetical protein VTG60DRAFT_330 [Thermothelomyces hinnuleus]